MRLRKAYTAMVWVGTPMFLFGCEVQAHYSVSWAWPVWLAVAALSLAGDEAYRAQRQHNEVERMDRDVARYQRGDEPGEYWITTDEAAVFFGERWWES